MDTGLNCLNDMSPASPQYAFFDLDGTLIKKDSYLPFLFGWLRFHPERVFSLFVLPFYVINYLLGRKERAYIKEAFLKAFMKGARHEDVDNYVKIFWRNFLRKYQSQKIVNELNVHHDQGRHVYIASASFDFYVSYLEQILPVEGVVATRAEWID